MMPKKTLKRLLISILVALQSGAAASAQEIVAVLGSEQRAQRETFDGFQAAFGKPVPVLALGDPIPADAKVVLAFGGKAAIQRYPARVTVIYAIAPGVLLDRKTHDGPSVKIMMDPAAASVLARLAELHPGLKRMAVLWSGQSLAASAERLVKAGAARGVAVTAERLEDVDDLPSRLRALKGRVDAIWLLPDPLLISVRTFETIKHFSYDNDVPFYAPTEGLAEQGAAAAVSVSYKEMGRMMAAAANGVLRGSAQPVELYADRVHVSVNKAAAAECALAVPSEALKTADKVLP